MMGLHPEIRVSRYKKGLRQCRNPSNMVGRVGIEPTTRGLRVRCSTN